MRIELQENGLLCLVASDCENQEELHNPDWIIDGTLLLIDIPQASVLGYAPDKVTFVTQETLDRTKELLDRILAGGKVYREEVVEARQVVAGEIPAFRTLRLIERVRS